MTKDTEEMIEKRRQRVERLVDVFLEERGTQMSEEAFVEAITELSSFIVTVGMGVSHQNAEAALGLMKNVVFPHITNTMEALTEKGEAEGIRRIPIKRPEDAS
jgi:hypothetical protein